MILLAIDTSANLCSVCLFGVEANLPIVSNSEDIGRGHAEKLMGQIADLLEEAGMDYDDLARVAGCAGEPSRRHVADRQ